MAFTGSQIKLKFYFLLAMRVELCHRNSVRQSSTP